MKKVFTTALILFVLGALLFAGGAVLAHGDLSVMDMETDFVAIDFTPDRWGGGVEYTYPAGDVERIVINAISDNVRVGYADDKLIHVLAGSERDVAFSPSEDGTLTVRQKKSAGFKLFSLDFGGGFHAVTVLIPQGFAPDLTVSNVSGDMLVDAGKLENVRLETTSGDVDVPSLACNVFRIGTVSGDVDLGTVRADAVEISTTSGDVDFAHMDSPGEIALSSTSGDIDGALADAREDYTITVSTVSGDCSVRSGGSGPRALNVKTVSGDIDIDFETR